MQQVSEELIIKGLSGSEGIAIGSTFVVDLSRRSVAPKIINSLQIRSNVKRFQKAKILFLDEIEELSKNLDKATREIFEAQKHIVSDVEIDEKVLHLIETEKFSVDYAIFETFGGFIERLRESGSEIFQQRIVDLENLRNRLIDLSCENEDQKKIPKNSILIVKEISPTDLVNFHELGIKALVMEKGGVTSHASIIAQSLEIPCVVSAKNVLHSSRTGTPAVVDGTSGSIVINPSDQTLSEYKQRIKARTKQKKARQQVHEESVTKDGVEFHLRANVEFIQELELVKKNRAEGVGLLRTEALLYGGFEKRSEEAQIEFYDKILKELKGPVTIRLFDVGGDKLNIHNQDEDNPFLGWRGIRMLLDEKQILENQLRSVLKVSGKYKERIQILVPMITDVREVVEVKQVLKEIKEELRENEIPFDDHIRVGVMVEVPSVALLASQFAKEVDFFSIGTNDLTQYTLAVDRGNERICELYQHNHPAVWQLIHQTIYAGNNNKVPVAVCGELAGDIIGASALIGMGVTDLSMSVHSIPRIKQHLRSHTLDKFRLLAQKILVSSSAEEVKAEFKALFPDYS
ncbi:MAG: phosphoenolpyruvate--protein phosphotransferase [Balneolaceae bacterium]|nr:phosphoenolpyruvate--protein phosphotransferase [Balneolaceae bacterium]